MIERRGGAGPVWELVCLAAGPAAGFAYALTASLIGGELDSVLLLRSAGMSAVLSVFNLLPSPPLDGGRMVQLVFGNKAAEIAGLLTASAVFLIGFAALVTGHGAALFLAGCGLFLRERDGSAQHNDDMPLAALGFTLPPRYPAALRADA